MFSWLSRAFTDHLDPILDALYRDGGLIENVRILVAQKNLDYSDKINSFRVLSVSQQIVGLTQGLELHRINKESDKIKLFVSVTPYIFDYLLFLNYTDKNIKEILSALNVLYEITDAAPTIEQIPILFSHLSKIHGNVERVDQIIDKTMKLLIDKLSVAEYFVSSSFSTYLINEIFPDTSILISSGWLITILTKYLSLKRLPNKEKINSIDQYFQAIKEENIPTPICIHFVMLFNTILTLRVLIDPEELTKFIENNGLETIFNFLSKQSIASISNTFARFSVLPKGTINSQVIEFMTGIISSDKNNEIEKLMLIGSIIQIISEYNDSLDPYYSLFPFALIFSDKFTNSQEGIITQIDLFRALTERNYHSVVKALPILFSTLNSFDIDSLTLETFFNCISELFSNNIIETDELLDSGFLKFFIDMDKVDGISKVLKIASFRNTLLVVLPKADPSVQWSVFHNVIKTEKCINTNDFTSLCVSFLANDAVHYIIKPTLEYVTQNVSVTFFSILITSFTKSETAVSEFINAGGLAWFQHLVDRDEVEPKLITVFIASLLHYKFFPEISEWISTLPLDHQIFKLGDEMLWQICLGPKLIKPPFIHVPALLPLLDSSEMRLTPNATYLASKYGLREFIRRESVDINSYLIRSMVNRYLTASQFNHFLHSGEKLHQFADGSFDHFALFEMSKGSESWFSLQATFKCVTFWIRVEEVPLGSFIEVFKTHQVRMKATTKEAIFTLFNVNYKIPLPAGKWSFVLIAVVGEASHTNIRVSVNKVSYEVPVTPPNDVFSDLAFGSVGSQTPSRWYIGSAIRIFSAWNPQVVALRLSGADNMKVSRVSSEVNVVTPYSIVSNRGAGVWSVPYNGFPSYIKRKKNFIDVVREIIISEDQKRVMDLINTLLKCYRIFNGKIHGFWPQIVRILKEKRNMICEASASIIFEMFFEYASKGFIEKNFLPICYDFDLWHIYAAPLEFAMISYLNLETANGFLFGNDNFIKRFISMFWIFEDKEMKKRFITIILRRIVLSPSEDLYFHVLALAVSADTESQNIVLNALHDMLTQKYSDCITSAFSFERIIDMIYTFEVSVAKKLLNVMVIICMNNYNFFQHTPRFVFATLKFLGKHSMWVTLFSILTGTLNPPDIDIMHFLRARIVNRSVIATIVSFALSGIFVTLCGFGVPSEGGKSFDEFRTDLFKVIKVLTTYSRKNISLFSNPGVMKSVLFYVPLILNPNLVSSVSYDEPQMDDDFSTQTFYYERVSYLWNASPAMISSIEEPNDLNFFQSSVAPIMALFATIITTYFPTFRFDLEKAPNIFEKFEGFDEIVEFVRFLILAQAPTPGALANSLGVLEVSMSDYMNVLAEAIVESVIVTDGIIGLTEGATEELLFFTARVACRKPYQNHTWKIHRSMITFTSTFANSSHSAMMKRNEDVFSALRAIIYTMFDNCEKKEIVELMHQIGNNLTFFSVTFPIFSDFDFAFGFLSRSMEYIEDNQSFSLFIKGYIKNIMLSSKIRSEIIDEENPVQTLMLQKLMVGLENLQKRPSAYERWASENPDVVSSAKEFMSECRSRFEQTLKIHRENSNIDKVCMRAVGEFSTLISQSRHDAKQAFNGSTHLMSLLIQNQVSSTQRSIEKDFYDSWFAAQMGTMMSVPDFKPTNYSISYISWPMQTPRVIAPTNSRMPDVELGVTLKDDDFLIEVKSPDYLFKTDVFKDRKLAQFEYTSFDECFSGTITPIAFSHTVSHNKRMTYSAFVDVFLNGNSADSFFNAQFLKLTMTIPSAIFITQTQFLIVLNAEVSENELLLLKDIQSVIIYRSLCQLINIGMFGTPSLFCGHFVITIPFDTITSVQQHMWNHLPNSYIISSLKSSSFILINDKGFPQCFIRTLQGYGSQFISTLPDRPSQLFSLSLQQATSAWTNGQLTTHDYLLLLNAYGGRSFSDLSQYPIFPWVIADYSSTIPPPKQFRDLSKPMGQLDEERAAYFDSIFKDSNESYFYGSHYSMPASIHFYLARLPPYTLCEWDLHRGWDHELRIFSDVGGSWNSCSKANKADVKELIPELFDIPESYMNVCGFNGSSENFKVTLPMWAQSAVHFTNICKEALEEAKDINQWIDLIFGSAQMGPGAIAAKNVFLPLSYQQTPSPGEDIETLSLQLQNWGQCPLVLFKKPHQPRAEPSTVNLFDDISTISVHQMPSSMRLGPLQLEMDLLEGPRTCKVLPKVLQLGFFSGTKRLYMLEEPNLSFATHISKCSSNIFVCVDLDISATIVYQVIFKGSNIIDTSLVSVFTHDSTAVTYLDGFDFIAASLVGKQIVMWDFIRCTVHRVIELEEEARCGGFDEQNGWFWFATRCSIHCVTVNALPVAVITAPGEIQCIEVCDVDPTERTRPVVVGLKDGLVIAYSMDKTVNAIEDLQHFNVSTNPIVELRMNATHDAVFATDSEGLTWAIHTKHKFAIPVKEAIQSS